MFKNLDTIEAAKEFLVDQFPGSTVDSWKRKKVDEKDGVTVRSFEGPSRLSAAVVFNPNALEEQYAQILDTTGDYSIDKYDPSKFVNEAPKEPDEKVLADMIKAAQNNQQQEENQEEQESDGYKKVKVSKKVEKQIDDIIVNNNLNAMNAIIELNDKAVEAKQHIMNELENMGATYVMIEDKCKFVSGSEEFGKDVTKQKQLTTLSIKCISSDANLIRMQLGDYISAIYRKI